MSGFFLANPWGLLALLGLPAILLIHLLRRKSRQVWVSTLFLIERALPSSEGGRRVRRLRNSLPLWVQLLAVCALAWALVQPRWIDQNSTQTVVAVFDSSASLGAFRDQTLRAAATELNRLNTVSASTRWIFLRSDGSRLAAGSDLNEALTALARDWQPDLGTHNVDEALRLARTLAGEKGSVVYFSDRVPTDLEGVTWVASGSPLENVAFLGAEATGQGWNALVKNFGSQPADVRWRIVGQESWQQQRLEPGGMSALSGEWPQDVDRVTLELGDDAFTFDNRLPIIRPSPKVLSVAVATSEPFRELAGQLIHVAEPAYVAGATSADASLFTANPLSPREYQGPAILFVEDSGAVSKPLSGLIVAENHPLMANLNWQGLVSRETFGVLFRDEDVALLWQGSRPLIFLRSQDGAPQLVFNFDVRQSNATHLPAFALLVHRFFNTLRDGKVAYTSANVEARQSVSVAGVGPLQAPATPDFFGGRDKEGTLLFEGAAQFSDTRESDFQAAATARSGDASVEAIRQNHEQGAFLTPLWVFILAGLLLWNWFLTGAPRPAPRAA